VVLLGDEMSKGCLAGETGDKLSRQKHGFTINPERWVVEKKAKRVITLKESKWSVWIKCIFQYLHATGWKRDVVVGILYTAVCWFLLHPF